MTGRRTLRSADIALLLRMVRAARGLTQAEVAERARFAVCSVGAWEGRPLPERSAPHRVTQSTVAQLETSRRALAEWTADRLAAVYGIRFEGLVRATAGEDFEHAFLVPAAAAPLAAIDVRTGLTVARLPAPAHRPARPPNRARAAA